MPPVKAHENAAGDVAIGFVSDGVFVPVAGISAARVGHYVERGKDLREKAKAGDEVAAAQLAAEYDAPKEKDEPEPEEGGGS